MMETETTAQAMPQPLPAGAGAARDHRHAANDDAPVQASAGKGQRLDIIGGGITGLSAAYYALKSGVPADQIHIHEASERLGGKILSAQLDGKVVNRGAEFIDSTQDSILAMCNDLGVKLNESTDQGTLEFQLGNGQKLSQDQFFAAYKPIFDLIQADKATLRAAPDGKRAQELNSMTLDEYMVQLTQAVPQAPVSRSLWQIVTFQSGASKPAVSPEIVDMAKRCYESESGQAPGNVNALQFVGEASTEMGSMFDSDCAYRVEGGTEQIIHKLHEKLKSAGVKFHHNQVATKITHENGKDHVHFAGADKPVVTDKVVLALPAYKLKEIEGLEELGLAPQQHKLISEAQYTNSIKFTVKLAPGAEAPSSNYFSALGFQCWSDTPGQVTFLASNAGMDRLGLTLPKYVQKCMDTYAQGQGTTREAMFGDVRGNMVLTNPIASPCYASPGKNQQRELLELSESLQKLEAKGVSIAGTFLPNRTENGTEVGFMECGLKSAERSIERLMTPQRAVDHWQQQVQQPQRASAVGR